MTALYEGTTAPAGGLLDHLNATAADPEPAPARRQPGHAVEVFLDGEPEPFTVRLTNRERLAYEKTAARHKEWPVLDLQTGANQNHAMTFQTWAAAKRAERTTLTFPQWEEALLDWNVLGEEPADPTR